MKKPLEYLILERRKQEELRDEANSLVHYTKQFDLKVSLVVKMDLLRLSASGLTYT